ncbi:hypothetical protein GQ42DRAFT_38421 [Ramicandelaber brevisporus]|nr:hypothetical protein GQ42DRAFT_38421 [Ramicandelaber brevisporus]
MSQKRTHFLRSTRRQMLEAAGELVQKDPPRSSALYVRSDQLEHLLGSESDSDSEGLDSDSDGERRSSGVLSARKRAIKKKKKLTDSFICEHPGCGHVSNSYSQNYEHQHSHITYLKAECKGVPVTFVRPSLEDNWPCPFEDCEKDPFDNLSRLMSHVSNNHVSEGQTSPSPAPTPAPQLKQLKQHQEQHQHQDQLISHDIEQTYKTREIELADNYPVKIIEVGGVQCLYHLITGAYICNDCRLVPLSLATHLQEQHQLSSDVVGSINLPAETVKANHDIHSNQIVDNNKLSMYYKTRNGEFVPAAYPDVANGFCCPFSGCTYAATSESEIKEHLQECHRGEQFKRINATVLKLPGKAIGGAYYKFED